MPVKKNSNKIHDTFSVGKKKKKEMNIPAKKEITKQTYLRNQNDDFTYKDGYQESKKIKSKPLNPS